MTPQSRLDVKSIFGRALELDDPGRRAAYLAEACANAPAVQAEVEELLGMHARAAGFMRKPAGVVAENTANYEPPTEGPGTLIGSYKLLQQIGEGGMGTVFMAEQEEPVRRKVAVKIIKPGMDSKQVVARFEAERQALAMMDHTNIARVLDAGATQSGRPFFVMELVHGVPIIEYCDANKLTTRERLELFVPVCQAIQHAHQKGIIHRDIKPSNVLVTMYDDKPVPKVIDFGVAKAVEQRLTEKTLFTQYGALVGTFEYMSPEQAEMNAFGVDTRSDVYSLGVLLYELLTGTTPLERKRLRDAAFGEIVRLIKEEEPPRPSVRLSTSGTLAKVAEARNTVPAKLSSLVRGELDWIVMKCLEKDRTRRYDGASALSKDVQRHLAGDAVEAYPPTLGYRLRKAYRKNRGAVLTGGAFAAVLLVATGVSLAFGIAATKSERRAVQGEQAAAKSEVDARNAANEREMAINHLSGVLAKFNPYRYPDGIPPISVILDEACRSLDKKQAATDEKDKLPPIVRAKVLGVFGRMYMDIHEYQKGQEQLNAAYEELRSLKGADDLDTVNSLEAVANALLKGRRSVAEIEEAEAISRGVYAARVRVLGAAHPDTITTLTESLFTALFHQGKLAEIEHLGDQALAASIAGSPQGERQPQIALLQTRLANIVTRSGDKARLEKGRDLCRRAKETCTKLYGPDALRTLRAETELAMILDSTTDLTKHVRQLTDLTDRTIKACRAEQGPNVHRDIHRVYDRLALTCVLTGRCELAKEPTEKIIELVPKVYGERHPEMRRAMMLRATVCLETGDRAEAGRLLKKSTTEFEQLQKLDGGVDGASMFGLHILSARFILTGIDLKDTDFEEAKRHLEESEKNTIYSRHKFYLGTPDRAFTLRKITRVTTWIELYEKWDKREHDAELRRLQEELKTLTS